MFHSTEQQARTTCVDSCSPCMLLSLHACLWGLRQISQLAREQSQQQQQCQCICATLPVARESVLTALDVNSASGVVLPQRVLRHTRVIPRILQFCFADLDSGEFPAGDNTCTAESGESGQGGKKKSMETQQVGTQRKKICQQANYIHGTNSSLTYDASTRHLSLLTYFFAA